jgi:hypothetical protein
LMLSDLERGDKAEIDAHTFSEMLAVMLGATVKTDRNYFDDFFKSFNPQSDILSIIGNKV